MLQRSTGRETAVTGVVGVEESLRLLWGKGHPCDSSGELQMDAFRAALVLTVKSMVLGTRWAGRQR